MLNKFVICFIFSLSGLFYLTGCSLLQSDGDELFVANGQIQFQSLEGGFWGIVTVEGDHLDPLNLTSEFQVDSLNVSLSYYEAKDQVSFHMWGTLINIKEIHRRN